MASNEAPSLLDALDADSPHPEPGEGATTWLIFFNEIPKFLTFH